MQRTCVRQSARKRKGKIEQQIGESVLVKRLGLSPALALELASRVLVVFDGFDPAGNAQHRAAFERAWVVLGVQGSTHRPS